MKCILIFVVLLLFTATHIKSLDLKRSIESAKNSDSNNKYYKEERENKITSIDNNTLIAIEKQIELLKNNIVSLQNKDNSSKYIIYSFNKLFNINRK